MKLLFMGFTATISGCITAVILFGMTYGESPYEYEIELLNQEEIKLKDNKTDLIYTTSIDSLVYYLEFTNR